MKITMDVDITPEEVRKLFGLPDVEGFHHQLMDDLRERMTAGAEGYDPLKLFQPYVAASMPGWDLFQRLMSGVSGVQSTGSKAEDK
jgi:hypothetical protein